MKLLSAKYLFTKAKNSLLRFPLVIACAFAGVMISLFLVEFENDIDNKLPYINGLLTFALGVPLFFCIGIFSEKSILSSKFKIIIQLLGVVFLGLIYWSFPTIVETHNTSIPYIRYGIFNITIHLLVSYAPYIKTKELNGFWNYNKSLFLRLCTSVLYSGFIYVGLVLALVAVDNLFHVDLHDELYFEIYIVVIGLFNTWFFISGVPKDLDELEDDYIYPKGLKVFTQYVLVPLLILYLVILYAYGGKILINWNWPKGWVSYLVSGVSILAFFTILLIYPYGKQKENGWIKKFTKILYYVLIPLVALLFIAIGMRIGDYGITIKRYSVLVLGIWITFICFFFLLKKNNIKMIPISLSILLLLSSFGPWGMFSVSERSQINRLKNILETHKILIDDKIQNEVKWIEESLPSLESAWELTNNEVLNVATHNKVKSILDYLDDYHGMKKIRPWFQQDLDTMISDKTHNRYSHHNEAGVYMRTMGLKYTRKYNNTKRFHYKVKENDLIDISGYNYYYSFYFYNDKSENLRLNESSFNLSRKEDVLYVTNSKDSIQLNLTTVKKELFKKYGRDSKEQVPESELTFVLTSETMDAKIKLKRINFTVLDESIDITNVSGSLFLNEK